MMRQLLATPMIFFALLLCSKTTLSQVDSAYIKEIKRYVKSVDSLRNAAKTNFDSPPTITIGTTDGEYSTYVNNEYKNIGGFTIYTVGNLNNDSAFFIGYEGGKNGTYVTQKYYYRKDELVYSQITIEKWATKSQKPYQREEYYRKNKPILITTKNSLPKTKDKSLFVSSLFKEGTNYLNDFNKEHRK